MSQQGSHDCLPTCCHAVGVLLPSNPLALTPLALTPLALTPLALTPLAGCGSQDGRSLWLAVAAIAFLVMARTAGIASGSIDTCTVCQQA